jgi:protein-S-isoprenylcysteine O-methyltransferase Ste14
MWLSGRALLAFLMLPGTVGFLIPWLIARGTPFDRVNAAGVLPLAAGTVLLLWCTAAFYRMGRGTLAPWDPPERLVARGPYRISRNPMYVAVLLILAGWAIGFDSWPLTIYAAGVAVAFQLRIVYGEEPWLARRYGPAWEAYKASVPRWIGRRQVGSR